MCVGEEGGGASSGCCRGEIGEERIDGKLHNFVRG